MQRPCRSRIDTAHPTSTRVVSRVSVNQQNCCVARRRRGESESARLGMAAERRDPCSRPPRQPFSFECRVSRESQYMSSDQNPKPPLDAIPPIQKSPMFQNPGTPFVFDSIAVIATLQMINGCSPALNTAIEAISDRLINPQSDTLQEDRPVAAAAKAVSLLRGGRLHFKQRNNNAFIIDMPILKKARDIWEREEDDGLTTPRKRVRPRIKSAYLALAGDQVAALVDGTLLERLSKHWNVACDDAGWPLSGKARACRHLGDSGAAKNSIHRGSVLLELTDATLRPSR